VQPGTGSDTDIFFLVYRRANIAAGSGFFLPFLPVLVPLPFFRGFVKPLLSFNDHSKLNCVQNLNVKSNWYLFSYKRVTDPRVFLAGGASLDVSFTFEPTGSDTRLQIFSFT
jgi:hypothetical protein